MITQQIVGKLQKLLHQHEENLKQSRTGLLNSIRDLDRLTGELTLSELHVIACIGKQGQVNVTAISQEMDMTRGAISKISTKLLQRGYLVKKQRADNQKEVHFQLTPMGDEIFRLHEELHEQAGKGRGESRGFYKNTPALNLLLLIVCSAMPLLNIKTSRQNREL